MILRVLLLSLILFSFRKIEGQELLCQVDINTDYIEGTNKSIFERLKESIEDYLNETKWTQTVIAPNERIEGKLLLTVTDYSNNRVKGDIQVQLSRPVFNSSYTTTLLNFKDNNVEFDYREGEPLIFNDLIWTDNLTAILNFYAYLFLALDFDSFSLEGGQPYFDKAASVVRQAQGSGAGGWKMFEDNRNRSAVLNAFTDNRNSGLRKLLYAYHRKGLDEMVTNPDKGRLEITESLGELKKINELSPMSVGLVIFKDSKIDELVNIYSAASPQERDKVYEILNTIYPTEREKLEKIRKGNG